MAKFSIIDAKTGQAKYSGAPRYNGTYCKVSYLEFAEICSDAPIRWNVGDYVVYTRTGLTYKLYDIPQPKKRAYKYEYGGAFVYSNVQFFPDTKLLEIEPLRDIVPSDVGIHFTTQASWSVWTNAASLVDRFNAVMNTAYPGQWEFRLVNAAAGTPLCKLLHDTWFNFTSSGDNVLQGLEKLYDLCGNIGWVHSVENGKNVITVGIPPIYEPGIGTVTHLKYQYGHSSGLTELRKTTTNRNELKTRLFAYGSTRNMISRYYNNRLPEIKDAKSVFIPNLMLPLSKWGTTGGQKDASKAFIDNNVDIYGLRPETVYFDGSNGQKEIYPSIEETTIGEIYDAMPTGVQYRPDLSKHSRDARLDEIESVSGIDDDGQRAEGGDKYSISIDIPIDEHEGTYYARAEIPLFTDVIVPSSATFTLPFSSLVVSVGPSQLLPPIVYYVIVDVRGVSYATTLKSTSVSQLFQFEIPDLEIKCELGDVISARLILETNAQLNFFAFLSPVTLKAEGAKVMSDGLVVRIPQIGFDISKRARLGTQGLATISMKDGKCGGRSFVVKSVKYDAAADSWDLTLYRGLDESLDTLFPNTIYPIEAGNHFVLLDIAMPDTYIGMAEIKLLSAATELLKDISVPKPLYEPIIDAKYMMFAQDTLLEGMYMSIDDEDIIDDTEHILIDAIVINEDSSEIPTYKVTLREQKRITYSKSQVTGNELKSLASGTNAPAEISAGITVEQKELLEKLASWFGEDENGDIFVKRKSDDAPRNFYNPGGIASGKQS